MAEPLPFHSDYVDSFLRGFQGYGLEGFSPSYVDIGPLYASGSMEATITRLPTRVQCLYCTVVNIDNEGLCMACGAPLPDRLGQ
jgi:hypothetical protein